MVFRKVCYLFEIATPFLLTLIFDLFPVLSYVKYDRHGRLCDFTTAAMDLELFFLLRRLMEPLLPRLLTHHEFIHTYDPLSARAHLLYFHLPPQERNAFAFLQGISDVNLRELFVIN